MEKYAQELYSSQEKEAREVDQLFRVEKPQAWVKNWIYRNEKSILAEGNSVTVSVSEMFRLFICTNIYVVFLRTVNK